MQSFHSLRIFPYFDASFVKKLSALAATNFVGLFGCHARLSVFIGMYD